MPNLSQTEPGERDVEDLLGRNWDASAIANTEQEEPPSIR